MGGKNIFGFPPTLLSKLRYCDTVPITSTVGSIGKYTFRINSLFDPDFTGVGHQPLYRDTFAAIYALYTVVSADIKLTVVNTSTVPVHAGAVFEDDTGSSSSVNVLMEQNTGVHHLIPAQAGSISSHTFRLKWDCQKMLGLDPYTDIGTKAIFSADPTYLGAMTCWLQPVDAASTTTGYLNIEIDQLVFFSDLQTPSLS